MKNLGMKLIQVCSILGIGIIDAVRKFNELGVQVAQGYGLTETSPVVAPLPSKAIDIKLLYLKESNFNLPFSFVIHLTKAIINNNILINTNYNN